jgi:ABC-2 type transport system permease protein
MTTAIGLALRLGRWGIIGYAGVAFVASLVNGIGFYEIAGNTATQRASFAASMSILASQFAVILPPPIHLETVGGYVQWRGFGFLTIIFSIWAMVSASGAARGDEERGLVDVMLATGLSRGRALTARAIAFALGALAAALAAGAGFATSVVTGHETFEATHVVEACVVIAALAVCAYGLTLLVAQFTSERSVTAVAGLVMLTLFLLNSLSRTFDVLRPWRVVSPFYYAELSKPLPPGGMFDLGATIVLLAIAFLACGFAQLAFAARDLGSPLVQLPARSQPPSFDVDPLPAWRLPVVRDLYERRFILVIWVVGMSTLAVIMALLTRAIVDPLLAIPALRPYFDAILHGAVYPAFLGFVWFGVAQLLMAGFAIAEVGRWSTEDGDGRLEHILSQPVPRAGVVLERAVTLAIGALIVAAASGAAVGFEAHQQSIDVDTGHLVAATLLLVPFTLVFAAAGSLMAARIPRATVGLLGVIAFASYLLLQLGPIFKLPEWVQDLSAFKLYGQPLTQNVDQTGLVIMVAIVVIGFGLAVVTMRRRDIGA